MGTTQFIAAHSSNPETASGFCALLAMGKNWQRKTIREEVDDDLEPTPVLVLQSTLDLIDYKH